MDHNLIEATVRTMCPEDYPAVRALWDATPGVGMRSLDDSREGVKKFLARNPSTCFVAEQDGAVVGVILCGHDGRRGYIYHMAVAPECRRQGIGSALLDHALAALKAGGINKAALVVYKNNGLGNAFWESKGFVERGDLVYRNISLNDLNI